MNSSIRSSNKRTSRRNVLKYTTASVASLGLAGCQSLSGSNQKGNDGTGDVPEDVPDDLFKGETLKIGGLFPLPEDFGPGYDGLRATQLAVREHNRSENGVLGGELELLSRDTGAAPAPAQRNARELIVDENVDVIQGGMLGQAYKQMLEPAANNRIMSFYTAGASNAVLSKMKENWDRYDISFYTMNNMYQVQLSEALFIKDIAEQMGWDRIGIYTENVELFDPLGQPLADRLNEITDVDIPVVERTSTSILNWDPLFNRLEEQNCDIGLFHLVLTGTTAARQWGTQERPFDMGGINLYAMTDDFWESVGKVCPGLWTMNHGGIDSQQTERIGPMMDRFEEEWDYRTNTYSAYTMYDMVNIWVDAVKQTGSIQPADLIPYLEERYWENSVLKPDHEYFEPGEENPWIDETTPHCMKWVDSPTVEEWNREGWLPVTQIKGEKGGEGAMRTIAPKRSAGGEYKVDRAPWIED